MKEEEREVEEEENEVEEEENEVQKEEYELEEEENTLEEEESEKRIKIEHGLEVRPRLSHPTHSDLIHTHPLTRHTHI